MKIAAALFGLLSLGLAATATLRAEDPFADEVISYIPGTGQNTSFENSGAALGAPTSSASITAPPFSNTQIVGIGNGGELTVEFNSPILNDPADHADGMDLTIFGNEFFTLNSGGISGIFNHTGLTVWVSQDNVTYYELNSSIGADDLFPSEGSGDPGLPINPAFTLNSFIGLSTSQALSLYDGSAGGASYSISSAEDSSGDPVDLSSVSYVRIQGSGGFGYVDAIARVESVPEPAQWPLAICGLSLILIYSRNKPKWCSRSNTVTWSEYTETRKIRV